QTWDQPAAAAADGDQRPGSEERQPAHPQTSGGRAAPGQRGGFRRLPGPPPAAQAHAGHDVRRRLHQREVLLHVGRAGGHEVHRAAGGQRRACHRHRLGAGAAGHRADRGSRGRAVRRDRRQPGIRALVHGAHRAPASELPLRPPGHGQRTVQPGRHHRRQRVAPAGGRCLGRRGQPLGRVHEHGARARASLRGRDRPDPAAAGAVLPHRLCRGRRAGRHLQPGELRPLRLRLAIDRRALQQGLAVLDLPPARPGGAGVPPPREHVPQAERDLPGQGRQRRGTRL
ncbi:MAG: hypothetical protein AVDCRST_MAG51-789, partial [uncultured Ramlibacter sp.]